MANHLNKEELDNLSCEYEKQRQSFIADLKRFNANRGTPFDHIPEIGSKEVDLYHLYQRVTARGGWQKVNVDQLWEDFQEEFGLPKGCVNAAQALKNIYFRYLNLYEKVNFLGEDADTRNNEEEDGPARKKICLPIETIPLIYNYNQHKLTEAQRQQYNLSTELYEQSDYEKLEMSLRSGLPNEVDVAFNVCVLLSKEGKYCIKLEKSLHLLNLIFAHIGIFEEDSLDMQHLYKHCWASAKDRDFLRFWFETVDKVDIRKLITWQGRPYSQRELVGSDVLNLGRSLGTSDLEGQRVMQTAVFLYNLSFEEANQRIMAENYLVFKFLVLSLHSKFGGLKQLALDTFANLSCEFEIDSVERQHAMWVLELLNDSLYSEDRFLLVRGLEILSKISQLSCNETPLLEHLKEDVYSRLIDLLTVQDIQLIVHTLEALYKLSKVGEPFTTRIAKVHKAIDTLVSLITIEAQSFGPGSLVGIKVVEYIPPAHLAGENAAKSTTVIQPVNPDSTNIYQIPSGSFSPLGVISDSGGGNGPGGGEVTKVTPPVREPVTDIQTTTSSWLNATFELKKKSKVNQVELFSDYLQFCRKFQINNAMSSAEFLHLVKVIFPQSEVLSINRKNGDRDVFFEGICKRSTQRPFAVTTLPLDKVRNPLSVNVSPKQTQSVLVDSLAHTPTLRQRLMEPPRASLHPQFVPAGASVSTSTPLQGTPRFSHSQSAANIGSSAKVLPGLQGKLLKNGKLQTALNVKRGLSYVASTGTSVESSPGSAQHAHRPVSQSAQNSPHTSLASAQPFSSASQTGQVEQSSDALSVKSLLAKKLSQGNADQDMMNNSGANGSYQSSSIMSHAISQSSQTCLGSSQTSVALTSNQVTLNKQTRPVVQTFSSSTQISSFTQNSSSGMANQVQNMLSSATNSNQLSNQQHIFTQSSTNTIMVQPKTNQNPLIVQQTSSLPTSLQNSVTFVQRSSNVSCIQNNQFSVVHQNARVADNPQTTNISMVAQQQPVCMQLVHQNSANGTNVVHQSTPSVSCAIIPKTVSVGQVHNSSGAIGALNPQCVTQPSSTQPSNIPVSHIIRNPSNILVTNNQSGSTNSTALTIASANTVTQTISSPAVAALLTSTTQQGSQMILSSPLLAGGSVVQAAPSIAGPAPTTVVIQTQPGALVMQPRQVLVQGNGSGSFGTLHQGTGGTVSFIVPSHYRGGSSVTVPGINFLQSGVNVVPSIALTNTNTQPPTQTIIHAAQNQNIIQVAQNQQNLIQTNSNCAGTTSLGPRQIVLTPNQTSIPYNVQIAGNFARNASNICIAPQQQKNFVIQSASNQTLPQSAVPATGLGFTMNISQSAHGGTQHNSTIQIPSQILESQVKCDSTLQQTVTDTNSVSQLSNPTSTVLPSQCNGMSHESNGILGSPESVCSDFPPSPLSVGNNSDKDSLNGKLETDRTLVLKHPDVGKLVEKTSKINGFVYPLDNTNHDLARSNQNVDNESPMVRANNSDSKTTILVNGCLPVNQGQNVNNQHSNIPSTQLPNNINNSNGLVHQTQSSQVQTVQLSEANSFPSQQIHQQATQHSQPAGISHQQGTATQSPHIATQTLHHQRVVQQSSCASQTLGSQQQLKPKISTLPTPGSSVSSQGCNTNLRPVFSRDASRDSDTSNDSVISTSDSTDKMGNIVAKKVPLKKTEVSPVQDTRKKKKSGLEIISATTVQTGHGTQIQKTVQIPLEYMCEWSNCRKCFSTSRLVFIHVFKHHIPKTSESSCQWVSCEKLNRKRWSLVSHVQDHHCSEMAMRNACQRRFAANLQQAKGVTSTPSPAPHQPMIYPPDAAMQAIRRFTIKPPYAEFTEQREGPVSKHIRLTAALILRNICRCSSSGRRLLRRHEQQLTYHMMSSAEASTALASCLWEIMQCCEQKTASSSLWV
ncbi:AT-rich interactive domain-containing protein 2-like isoform X1 [Biomphalaria pfeifferi]|uniref:AT-rich interactive domain-containing protein 2-like isoform X1 n=1 Tax=Biomphalaria pfeifferi TaxID=112525 RepID=A0AAD8BDF3_BIOPF|nr:AT-rich interactive domain-containing protein 2-like isoform X1 [Biomphalaria pfeifferi]